MVSLDKLLLPSKLNHGMVEWQLPQREKLRYFRVFAKKPLFNQLFLFSTLLTRDIAVSSSEQSFFICSWSSAPLPYATRT
jgi:hypothetical protein